MHVLTNDNSKKGQVGFPNVEEDVSTEKLLDVSCSPVCCVVSCHMSESMDTTQIICCWYWGN